MCVCVCVRVWEAVGGWLVGLQGDATGKSMRSNVNAQVEDQRALVSSDILCPSHHTAASSLRSRSSVSAVGSPGTIWLQWNLHPNGLTRRQLC